VQISTAIENRSMPVAIWLATAESFDTTRARPTMEPTPLLLTADEPPLPGYCL
jgi:hypothetical protein